MPFSAKPLVVFCACSLFVAWSLMPLTMHAQGTPRGFWPVAGSNAAHDNAQKAETLITTETVTGKTAGGFQFLWKLKLGNETSASYSEPLLVPGMITGKGFKDFAFVGSGNTLYAVDSELGSLVWQHDFTSQPSRCGGLNIQIATEAPQVIHFGAHRPAASRPASHTPAPPANDEPLAASARRVGASAGGGYFGLKGVYVLTSDGYLHEQIMATGLDYAPPVKFLTSPAGQSFGLNMNDKIVYASQGSSCKSAAKAIRSIDLNTSDYAIHSYEAQKLGIAGMSGPSIGSDGTAYVFTGSGPADATAGVYPDSVVALDANEFKAKDWYAPAAGGQTLHASPVVVSYKGKDLIVAPGKDGSLVLLDSASLGGADHHTPLAESGKVFKVGKREAWEGLSSWQDKAGNVWVFASVAGPVVAEAKLAGDNGPAPHGSIVAFHVEDKDGHTVLTPAWASRDLINPAPAVAANGVIFALDGGNASAHATLYALDAATGKQLYSSGDAIHTYTRLAGMAAGDGHVFFMTHDNTLYSFGIPLEH